jgi:hypothetical protein
MKYYAKICGCIVSQAPKDRSALIFSSQAVLDVELNLYKLTRWQSLRV